MKKTNGFTIGEMVIVIAIIAVLAALITPLAVNQISQARYNACKDELILIKKSLVGDPALVENGIRSSFGFVGDLGGLPITLDELVNQNTLPPFQQTGLIWWGWNGPYINEYLDPWRRPYNYTTTGLPGAIIGRIWSNGKNGTNDSGTGNPIGGDDNYIDIYRYEAFSMICGNTFDECGAGFDYSNITVSYPHRTSITSTLPISSVSTNPIFSINQLIPIGIRVISIQTPIQVKYIYINNGPLTVVDLKKPGPCN